MIVALGSLVALIVVAFLGLAFASACFAFREAQLDDRDFR